MAAPVVKQAQDAAFEATAAEGRGDIQTAIEKHFLASQLYSIAAGLSSHGRSAVESLSLIHQRKAHALSKGASHQKIFNSRSSFAQTSQTSVSSSTPSTVISNSQPTISAASVDRSEKLPPALELSSMMESVDCRYLSPDTFAAKSAAQPVHIGLDGSKYDALSSVILEQLSREEEEKERERERERELVLQQTRPMIEEQESGPTDSLFDNGDDDDDSQDEASNQPISILRKLIDQLFDSSTFATSGAQQPTQNIKTLTPSNSGNFSNLALASEPQQPTFSQQRRLDEEMNLLLDESLAKESDLLKSFYLFVPSEPSSEISHLPPGPPVNVSTSTATIPAPSTTPSPTPSASSGGYTSTLFGTLSGFPSQVVSTLQAYSPFASIPYLASAPAASTPAPTSIPVALSKPTTTQPVLVESPTANNQSVVSVHPPPSIETLHDDQTIQQLYSSVLSLAEKNANLSQKVAQTQQMAEENEVLKKNIVRFRKEAVNLLQTRSNKRTGAYSGLSGSTMNPKLSYYSDNRPRSNSGQGRNLAPPNPNNSTGTKNGAQENCADCTEKIRKLEDAVHELRLTIDEKDAEIDRLKELLKQANNDTTRNLPMTRT